MFNPVFDSLEENLRNIELVVQSTVNSFTNDKENTGDHRELTVQQFISSYLTSDYQIKKGRIYNLETSSNSIDCVVLYPNHPKLITPQREVIIAEGVYAAIEVKPDITTLTDNSEFQRGLNQIQSVKKLSRHIPPLVSHRFGVFGRSPYFKKIPGIIFSFKSRPLIDIVEYIQGAYSDASISDNEFPDIIISMDKGILFYCPHIKETIFKSYLDSIWSIYPDRIIVEIQLTGSKLLTWFLSLFFNLPAPNLDSKYSILSPYLEAAMYHVDVTFHPLDASDVITPKTV